MYTKETVKPFIIQCMVMRLSEKDSMKYLKDRGFKVSRQYFYRLKKSIAESRFDRLTLIAKTQFVDQHLERINLKVNDSGWSIPDPDREGYFKWNRDPNFKSDWIKTLEEETRLRREVMKRVIESRGEKVPKEKTLKQLQEEEKNRIKRIEEAYSLIGSKEEK